jgi:SPX domain protein involved in polyphosphate accumulation
MYGKKRRLNENRAFEVLTSVNIPLDVLKDIKFKGLSLKACVLKGYKVLTGEDNREREFIELRKELQENMEKVSRLSGKISELSQVMYSHGLDPFKIMK